MGGCHLRLEVINLAHGKQESESSPCGTRTDAFDTYDLPRRGRRRAVRPGAAAAIENALVETIASAEKSVVAVARVRKEQSTDVLRLESRPDAFGGGLPPTDPSFVPNEYGAGVVIDRRGLILTACHVLGDENDNYYITTAERRVYRAWIKAADPRSDLAVLSIDGADVASANLVPIRMGDAATLRKGQIVVTLGNPYAIARDGQASAGWGIVSNLNRKAPPVPDETDAGGKTTLQHYGGLIQTDARLHLGASGGPLLNLRGEMIGLCISQAATAGYESAAGYAIPVDATFRRVLERAAAGPRGRIRSARHPARQPATAGDCRRLAGRAPARHLAGHACRAIRPPR